MDFTLIFLIFFILLFSINGSVKKKTISEVDCLCGFLLILATSILFINGPMIETRQNCNCNMGNCNCNMGNCNMGNCNIERFNLGDFMNDPSRFIESGMNSFVTELEGRVHDVGQRQGRGG